MSEPGNKAVFLSYAREDAPAARRMADALRQEGLEVWFDESELRGGDAWDTKIRKQIRECALFVPIISQQTNARLEGYFRREWRQAVDRTFDMAEEKPFLVPVVIDETIEARASVPEQFRTNQWTRLLGGETPPAFCARIRSLLDGTGRLPAASPPGGGGRPDPRPAGPAIEMRQQWRPAPEQTIPNTRWRLEKKLGEGPFGEVWLGHHLTMRERRVFKFSFHADRVRTLKREMTLFRVLKERVGDHPHIVRVLDVHFDEPPFYLAMDYVDGHNLKSWCEQQGGVASVPLATRLEIVAQIADALHAAHSVGVVHRDVKPGNILIAQLGGATPRPLAKLSDFGQGQISEEAQYAMTMMAMGTTLTRDTSDLSTTQIYTAPELLAGQPASPRSDLYSLGVVLFQLLVGNLRRPLTTDWQKSVDDPVLRVDLERCFAGNLDERFSTADQLACSLRAVEARRVEAARKAAEAVARAKAMRWWKIVALVAVVVGVVIGLSMALRR